MIEDVEHIGAKLHSNTFSDLSGFTQCQIEVPEMRAVEGIPPQIPKRSGRSLECVQIQAWVGSVRDSKCIAHQVWMLDELTAAIEIVEVIHIERHSRRQRK